MTAFDPRTVRPTDRFPDARRFGAGPFPGQQFPGPVPPPPSRPSRKRPLAAKIVAGLVAAGLVVGGAGTWMAFSGSTAEAAVQSTSFAGANPTTSPFGTDAPQVAAVSATGPQAGDTKGLFAATDPASCDNAAYLRQLQAEPAKLAAVGGVFGLGPADVPAFVNSLSPVVLRANTSVTDHPYSGGAFTEQPAILAAGTAVLVNSYGEPTVKCFNGNPLTAGAPTPSAVTVDPTRQVITSFQFTNVDDSRVVVTPGKPDPKPHPGPNPVPDPVLKAKAEEARKAAEQSAADATAGRERADKLGTDARVLRSESDRLGRLAQDARDKTLDAVHAWTNALSALKAAQAAVPVDPVAVAAAEQARLEAINEINTADTVQANAEDAAKAADTTAKEAEGKAKTAADTAADLEKKAKEAADAAETAQKASDESAKHPNGTSRTASEGAGPEKVEDQEKNKVAEVTGPTTIDPSGRTPITGQASSGSAPCGVVSGAAAAAKGCGTPPGSATAPGTSTATTPAGSTGGSTSTGSSSSGTGSGSSSTGTGGSSSSGSSTGSSSSSTGGSQSGSAKGAGK